MKKLLTALLLIILTGAGAEAQQIYQLTVKEAIDLAFNNLYELKNARLDYDIQVAKNREILGQALPQITGNASANHYLKLPTVLFPQDESGIYGVLKRENLIAQGVQPPAPTLLAFSFQQPYNSSAGVNLNQLLFQPDVFVGLQARQTALDYSSSLIDQTKERIKDSAYKRYYGILIAQKQLFFLNESYSRLQKLYHDDSIMYVNGFAERLDLDKVMVQLNNLRTTKTTVESGVKLSYAAMKFAIGISQKDSIILRDDLTVNGLKSEILVDSFQYEDRAEIRTLNQLQRLQKLDVKRYKLGYLPTVSLAGNYSANGMGQKFFTDNSTFWYKAAFVGLNLNLPIFDGFQRRYRVVQSRLNLQKIDNNVSNLKQAIDLEQVATRETLMNALYNLDVQDQNMELAQRVYNGTKLKFEQGLGSSFEVLQADTDYQQAQANYFNALYNATVARISYLYSLGKL